MIGSWVKRFIFILVACVLFLKPVSAAEENTPASDPAAQEEKAPAPAAAPAESPAPAQPAAVSSSPAAAPAASNHSAAPAAAPAPPAPPKVISSIEIRGNQIVSTNTILSKIKLRKGDLVIQETINEDIKRLYASGYFQDIEVQIEDAADGLKLIFFMIEKPVIREITITGAVAFKEDKLRKTLKVLEGQILDRKAVKIGVDAIKKLYSDKAFRFVDIQSSIDVNPKTREAIIRIEIQEGQKYKIRDLTFEGVTAYKPKKLQRLMKTHKKSFPFRSGVFKENLFQKDLEKVQLFYQQEGYLDAKLEPSFDYDKDKQWIFVKISVEEGKHYITGDVKIEGNQLFPESEIWQELEMLPGTTYSQYYISRDIQTIINYYHKRGYMDARVVPDVNLDKETGKVDVKYQIQEGDLYFIDRVIIRGNTKTKDIVIRRELKIRPGEKFDGEKIDQSKSKLQDLDYFEDITYDTEPGTAANRKDLVFRVKEKRTGELSFGGGVSSVDGFVGFAEISQKNFDILNWPRLTGGGQTISLRGRLGSISQDFSLNFTEPYLFNKPVALDTELYRTRRYSDNVDFDETRTGAGFTVVRRFRDIFRTGPGYTLENVRVHDISEDATPAVTDFAGNNVISKLRWLNSIDTRDSIVNPTKGTLITLNGDVAAGFIGSEHSFYVLQTSASKFFTFFKKHLLEAKIRLGASDSLGGSDAVPVFDRFFAGGLGTVRGFNYRRIGPLEAGNNVGGQTLAVVNLEYTVPVYRLDFMRFAVFIDTGHVNREAYHIDFGGFATSVGPGVKVKTPLGPIALYYGYPIANRDTENRNGRFEFSLSRGF